MLGKKTTPAQIDVWRTVRSEDEHLEFKEAKNQFDSDKLLKYCVALANERGGKLLLGIQDKSPRAVVGTKAFPNPAKTAHELFNELTFRVDVEEVLHPDGRVLIFHVPSRPLGHAYNAGGSYWMRSGESLVAMTMDQLRQIAAEGKSDKTFKPAYPYVLGAILLIAIVLLILWRDKQRHGMNEKLATGDNVAVIVKRDWRNKQNWRAYLKVGMTKAQVQDLFGEAEEIDVSSNLEFWDYGSGRITFADGKTFSWLEPHGEETPVQPGKDSKKPSSPPIVVPAPYGNLAKRCSDLATGILNFVEERSKTKPDARTNLQDYLDWFTRNDGQFRVQFSTAAKDLQRDLAASNIKDRRLDELITKSEQFYTERNQLPPATAFSNAPMYHLSIEDIGEIGQRFKYLVTQIPPQ